MSLKGRLRDALPLSVRRTLRRGQRFAVDLYQGADVSPSAVQDLAGWHEVSRVRQPLNSTPNYAAKWHNIALATAAFSSRPITPGGLFSFWGWLGAPTATRGYCEGRALRQDQLVREIGGGLCQLAGAIYAAGLPAGVEVVERHAHSVDIYTDATRFTPLGSDATVSFGFKDLRLRNPHSVPIAFVIETDDINLTVKVVAREPVMPCAVSFRVTASGAGFVEAETLADGRVITRDRYIRHARSAAPP